MITCFATISYHLMPGRCIPQMLLAQHCFSAFWLRSKCSSYQLNIWYRGHVSPSISNWFLQWDEVQELAPASSRVGITGLAHVLNDTRRSPSSSSAHNGSLWFMVSIEWIPLTILIELYTLSQICLFPFGKDNFCDIEIRSHGSLCISE